MTTDEEITELARLIETWKYDIPLFAEQMFKATVSAQQREVLEPLSKPGAHVAVRSGHATGKSSGCAWSVLHALLCYDEVKVVMTAPSAHQLNDVLLAEISLWHSRMPQWFQDQIVIKATEIVVADHPRTAFAVARTSRKDTPDALQGVHAKCVLYIVDEAAGVPDEVYRAAEGNLATEGARAILIGNPTRISGYFHDCFNINRSSWTTVTLNSEESPFAAEKWIQKMKDTYGVDSDEYRIRVLGQFPRSEAQTLISPELAEQAIGRPPDVNPFAPVTISVDPAWMGGDRSVVWSRQGLVAELLFCRRHVDNVELAGFVAAEARKRGAGLITVDIGWGAGIVSILKDQGFPVIGIPFGGRPLDDQRFHDKRTEMAVLAKEAMEQGLCLRIDNPELRKDALTDITGPTYRFSMHGKMVMESKDSLKKRGLASPDLFDGLMLSYAFPVQSTPQEMSTEDMSRMSRAERQRILAKRDGDKSNDWNPWDRLSP